MLTPRRSNNRFTSAENIRKVTPEGADDVQAHPNKTTADQMKLEIDATVDSVIEAWQARYDSQSTVRIWPSEVINSPEFDEFFAQLDPPESFPKEESGRRMESLLMIYQQQIPNQMANIAAKAKTTWKFGVGTQGAKGAGGRENDNLTLGGDGGAGLEHEGQESKDNKAVVLWDDSNQDLWNDKLTSFKGRDDHELSTNVPSPLQVLMLQQDLWLLEAMFQIIGDVNEGAIATDLATIKQIDHIAFGREARAVLGSVQEPMEVAGGSSSASNEPLLPDSRPRRGFRRQTGGDQFDPKSDPSPFHGRYVNADFEPIGAETARTVLTGKDLPDTDLEMIVARRVPVRLAVVMDETKITDFIAACAKSPFTFEIHQIRINKHQPGEGISLAGGQVKKNKNAGGRANDNLTLGGGGGDAGLGGPDEGGGGGGNKGEGGGSISIGDVDSRNNFDVKVEFYGVVKIYNKVDEARLRGDDVPATNP